MDLLFLCVANSIRSQVAEGMARLVLPGVRVQSAGIHASRVHPFALQVLAEAGADTAALWSKDASQVETRGVDTVVTLCDEEVCPAALRGARQLRWDVIDPLRGPGDADAVLGRFRALREDLRHRLTQL